MARCVCGRWTLNQSGLCGPCEIKADEAKVESIRDNYRDPVWVGHQPEHSNGQVSVGLTADQIAEIQAEALEKMAAAQERNVEATNMTETGSNGKARASKMTEIPGYTPAGHVAQMDGESVEAWKKRRLRIYQRRNMLKRATAPKYVLPAPPGSPAPRPVPARTSPAATPSTAVVASVQQQCVEATRVLDLMSRYLGTAEGQRVVQDLDSDETRISAVIALFSAGVRAGQGVLS